MLRTHDLFGILITLVLIIVTIGASAPQACAYVTGDQVDTYDVGEVVDQLLLGFAHWSNASGDPHPDLYDDIADLSDSVGDHNTVFTTTPYSEWDPVSEQYGHSHWPFTLDPNNVMSFVMTAPAAGQYVVAFQGLFHSSGQYFLEYQKGSQWIAMPQLGAGGGYQTLLFCFVIDTDPGQTQIPMRIYSTGYKLGIGGFVLAKLSEDPFAGSDPNDPNIPHGDAMFDANEAAEIWARTTGSSFLYNRYLGVKNEGNANPSSYTTLSGSWAVSYSGKLLINTLFSELDGDTTRRNLAIQLLEKSAGWGNFRDIGRLHHGGLLRAISIAYDHLYEYLTPTQRANIRAKIDREARELTISYMTMNQWAHRNRVGNWGPVTHSGLLAAGLALRNESAYAKQYRDWGQDRCKKYLETALTASGSCREAYGSYYNYALVTLIPAAIMLRNISSIDANIPYEDLFDYDSGIIQTSVPYGLYLMAPMKDGFANFDDVDFGYSMSGVAPIAYIASYKQDPLAQWFVRNYAGEDSGRSSWPGWRVTTRMWQQLWYDPNVPTEHPEVSARMSLATTFTEDSLPGLARWGMGDVILRTGWSSDDDIAFYLQCGDTGGFHGHPDQGSFILDAYDGHLVSQAGKNGSYSSAGNEWTHGQTSSSLVLIDDKGQTDDHRWGSGRQRRDGTVDDFYHDASLADYVLANAEIAYDDGNNPVDKADRHVLFVRKPNRRGYFVIADDIQSSTPGTHDYSWLLHSSNWHSVVLGVNGQFRIVDSSSTYNGQASKFEGRDGQLQVVFATPQDPNMEIIVGETTVKGYTTFPPYVKSTYNADRGLFVTLLYPESTRLGITTPPVTRIDDANEAGFHIDDDLILFNKGVGNVSYLGMVSDATMIYLDMSSPTETRYLVANATSITVDGNQVFSSVTPVTTSGSFPGVLVESDPPSILVWNSAADHARGIGEVQMVIPDDGLFSEPRGPGVGRLLVTFDEPMNPASFHSGSVEVTGLDANINFIDLSGITISTAMRAADTIGEITFTPPLPDYAKYLVRIVGATDVVGNELTGDNDRTLTALVGDVYLDHQVNTVDLSHVRAALTRLIDPGNISEVRADVSVDGRVNVVDLSRIRPRRFNDANTIPDPGSVFALTVVNGSGDGVYDPNQVVPISADSAPPGDTFDIWTGDTATVANVNEPNTTITMPPSHTTVTATYKDFLPAPWQNMDVGAVGIQGNTQITDGNWTIQASGGDIWNDADQFHFVYQPWTGDAEIIARVTSVQNTHDYAKCGVMVRESLNDDSKNAFIGITPLKTTFQRRTLTGGTTSSTTNNGFVAPRWVKLTRVGNTLTGYRSDNGSTWTQVGSVTVDMAASLYVGIAVTSHVNGTLGTSTLESVSVSAGP